MDEIIQEFLNKYNYDIRISHNARWIDQKCTMDVLSLVADCIMEFLKEDTSKEFTSFDIWHSDYAVANVQSIFKKPDPNKKARNEYDKWFGQPLKLLGYSRILIERKVGNKNYYKLNNEELLRYISQRDSNSLNFLKYYIEKVITDSGIKQYFDNFFDKQDKESFSKLKDAFTRTTIKYTNINGKIECGRIFTKVLNPLAFCYNKKGTERGNISKGKITLDMLLYNRPNWRDNKDKPKDITRKEYESRYAPKLDLMTDYKIAKAKKILREFNNKYRSGCSEAKEKGVYPAEGTQIHHIFPCADFPTIADYLENLIVLTPTQHLYYAHPKGNTQYVDEEYQCFLLISKVGMIKDNLMLKDNSKKIYNFEFMIFVLNTGLKTEDFIKIKKYDFETVVEMIDFKYHSTGTDIEKVAEKSEKYTLDNSKK